MNVGHVTVSRFAHLPFRDGQVIGGRGLDGESGRETLCIFFLCT